MTITKVPITIVCPDWCEDSAEQHVENLHETGGHCHHHMPERVVTDPVGIRQPLSEPVICNPITLFMVTETTPEGRETSSPVVYIEADFECTLEQAEALATAILDMAAQYRAKGGD